MNYLLNFAKNFKSYWKSWYFPRFCGFHEFGLWTGKIWRDERITERDILAYSAAWQTGIFCRILPSFTLSTEDRAWTLLPVLLECKEFVSAGYIICTLFINITVFSFFEHFPPFLKAFSSEFWSLNSVNIIEWARKSSHTTAPLNSRGQSIN